MSSTRTTTSTLAPAPKSQTLAILRARTEKLHAQLEARFDLAHALSSLPNYRHLLKSYLGIYLPFERTMAAQSTDTLDLIHWSQRQRVPLLQQDLRALGISEAELHSTRQCSTLPQIHSLDSLLGALYVIEGSSLGGQILYREVKAALALDKDSGAAFFFGDGPDTGRTWQWFTALLQTHVVVPERAADTACEMFNLFERWLSQLPE